MNSVHTRVYETLDEMEGLRSDWEELLAAFPGATTFSTLEWLVPWWRAFGDRRELLVLACFDTSAKLLGVVPLQISRRRLASLLDLRVLGLWGDGSGDSDNLDIPVRPGSEALVSQALLDFLEKESARWDFCEFHSMPADSPVAADLAVRLGERRWILRSGRQPASAIPLPETWEAYLRRLSSKERRKIAYYKRRLHKKYWTRFYRCEGLPELPADLETLFSLHRKRWQFVGQPGNFASAARRQFYYELAHLLANRRELEFWFLELDGETVAAQFGFRRGSTFFSLQEGFNPMYFADSVGYVLRSHVIEYLIAHGVRRYDFLEGEASSKTRWATQASHYLNLSFAPRSTLGSAYLRVIRSASGSKEWLRKHVPANAWQMLHLLNTRIDRTGSNRLEPRQRPLLDSLRKEPNPELKP